MPFDAAVIFDCDGVLLELTRAEEDLFFQAFAPYCNSSLLSRSWNSYCIRNDDDIVDEIIETQRIDPQFKPVIVADYISRLDQALCDRPLFSQAISGAHELLHEVSQFSHVGLATANYHAAARLRLQAAGLWDFVAKFAFGADGGGHKHEILGRALAGLNLPKQRIVYIGDNLNDVTAGLMHGVHFIGFSTVASRREQLRAAGARHIAAEHITTLAQIRRCLD